MKCLELREMANGYAGSMETNSHLLRQMRTDLFEFDPKQDPKFLVRRMEDLRNKCVQSANLLGVVFSEAKWNYCVGKAAKEVWYETDGD